MEDHVRLRLNTKGKVQCEEDRHLFGPSCDALQNEWPRISKADLRQKQQTSFSSSRGRICLTRGHLCPTLLTRYLSAGIFET